MAIHLSELVTGFEAASQAARSATTAVVESAGGPNLYLERTCPSLLRGAPADLNSDHLADYSADWYSAAAVRYSRCGQCPGYGGACVTERQMVLDPGLQPSWQQGRIRLQQCDRWDTWEQVQKLVNSGVPERYATRASENVRVDHEAVLDDFIQTPQGRILEIQGSNVPWKRRVALRIMWSIFATRSRCWGRYVSSFTLMQRARDYYSKEAGDPFVELEDCLLLVVDSLPTLVVQDWWSERMGALLYERWTHGLSTIVLTDRDPVCSAYPMVQQVDAASLMIVTEEMPQHG